jgi:acyl carrier protein
MGLDSVEILMKVEDSFGIKIPDREAGEISTVGDFHNAVWQKLDGKYSDCCKSQGTFYRLRKSLVEMFNLSPTLIKPDLVPEKIIPVVQRRNEYFRLANSLNLTFPKLHLKPGWAMFLGIFGTIAIVGSFTTSLILINFFNYSNWMLLSTVIGIILTALLSNMLEFKRTIIPASTFREFTEEVLMLNYSSIQKDTGTNRQEMEMVINRIIADMAGLELEEVTFEKNIADDLGIS